MNKVFGLAIIGLLLVSTAKGQDLKRVTISGKFFATKEVFFVLKDNQEIRQGEYKRTSGKLKSIGKYENNKRVGVWTSYGYDGELIQTIDFASNTITNTNQTSDNSEYWIMKDGSYIKVKPDQAPSFIGGYPALYRLIGVSLRYPADARRSGLQGTVIISAVITKDGRIVDETVHQGLGQGTDEEALRLVKEMPDDWVAGKIAGELIDIKILILVKFKLA